VDNKRRVILQRYADAAVDFLLRNGRKASVSALGSHLAKIGRFAEDRKAARLNLKSPMFSFAAVFPELFEVETGARGGTAQIKYVGGDA